MEHFYMNIKGEDWFTYPNLYKQIVDDCNNTDAFHLVEVGSWKGKSACFMAVEIINSNKNIQFDCIDCWLDLNIYEEFIENIKPVNSNINVIREYSNYASQYYDDCSLDFVFIDAHHVYDSVKEDINKWYPKLKMGGILAGHDFWKENDSEYNSDVNRAVIDFFNNDFISTKEGCWIHIKNQNTIKPIL
jgi:predicted O-methyltransferase YrrM